MKRLAIAALIPALLFSNIPQNVWAAESSPTPKGIKEKLASGPAAIKGAAEKISKIDHPAAKLAKGSVTKAGQAYFVTLILLVVKEIFKRLSDEKLDPNQENTGKVLEEIESDWDIWEQATFKGADGLVLAPATMGVEWLVEKGLIRVIPVLETKAGFRKFLHSFVAGSVLSVGVNFINQTIMMAVEYLVQHPEKWSLTDQELKYVTLLQERAGMTYFTSGLWGSNGDPVRKSAYQKVAGALWYIIAKENGLRWVIWGHIWREAALNGSTLTTLFGTSMGGIFIEKILADAQRLKMPKKLILASAVASICTLFTPDLANARLTAWMREGEAALYKNHYEFLYQAKTKEQLVRVLQIGESDRISRSRALLSISKMATDKIEGLVSDQKLVVNKMDELKNHIDPNTGMVVPLDSRDRRKWILGQSSSQITRLEKRKASNQSDVASYQTMIKNSMDSILAGYAMDLSILRTYFEKPWVTEENRKIVESKIKKLTEVQSHFEKLENTLLTQYVPTDLSNVYSPEDYGAARLTLIGMDLWGYSEDTWIQE